LFSKLSGKNITSFIPFFQFANDFLWMCWIG
jgi:hypothetical protein